MTDVSAVTVSVDGTDPALFRHTPLPARLMVIDVHLNALGTGIAPGGGFYSAETLASMQADPRGHGLSGDEAAPRFAGGICAPPAGTDLLQASLALRDDTIDRPGWKAWLRLDDEGGARPPTGPLAAVATRVGAERWLPGGRRRTGDTAAVATALAGDPALLDGFAGVKLMPQQTGLPGAGTLAILAERGTPVLVHAGVQCPVRWLERHLLPHLSGPVVFAHLGSWPCAAEDLADAVRLAGDDERVHLETSGANIGNFLRHAVERVPGRILFGSNRPMCAPAVQFEHVAASVEDDATLAAIAHGNAQRLFGLTPPSGPPGSGAGQEAGQEEGPGRSPDTGRAPS